MRTREKAVDWDQEYRTAKSKLWEQKAHTYSRLATRYVREGTILDIGSGEGYDCIYFAGKGYTVHGLDISRSAIKKMLTQAKKYHLAVTGVAKDITKSGVRGRYDIIVSYGTLQFLGRKFKKFITDLKNRTMPGGVHSFYIFGNTGDFYNLAKHRFYFPSEKELKKLYSNWNIHKFSRKNTQLLIRGDRGEILHNVMYKILVQNPEH